ncbi:radical SAM family heme chaperone HemW [Tepidimonas charontis]|uniref:Heme chaperone HemW n=1 Tax=Tepidimonas charontis TaxID=2267262 RepID=A0A554XFE0_9BURK|nr:radical SAM family heme chaperone HemW [Tepidimonas charontis]TSE34540.1 Oxygen-independent coproporphyrinogen-III oxidase-like protein [Tepidimonas charontis]
MSGASQVLQRWQPGQVRLTQLPPLALYVHLPWCLHKCPYCDFNSHAWGMARGQQGALPQRAYMQALLADLEASLPLVWGRPVVSVFLGGGTPSLFDPDVIGELLSAIRARLPLQPDAEITLEANPGTFEQARFAAFRDAGVTRLSIGVQSFDDRLLRAVGRVHDGAQALAAVEEAARHYATFNIDLMYALPGQTLADWRRDLDVALALQPPHLSLYHLTIEPNTRFAQTPPPGLPDEDTAYAMLDALVERTAAAGLQRYEVSAHARAGHRCRHNLNYWHFGDYLGIGAGAHGKLSFAERIVRQVRWRDPARYQQQALAGQPVAQEHEVAARDLPFEFMLNALRLRDGFALSLFSQRTGLPITTVSGTIEAACQRGWLTWDRARDWVAPTALGFDWLSDLQALFLPD